jgi:hypothetical protein
MQKLLFFTFALLLWACRPSAIDPFADPAYPADCASFPDIGGIGYNTRMVDTSYTAPFYNPENGDEFLYKKLYRHVEVKPDGSTWQGTKEELWKFHLGSRKHQIITDRVWLDPKWGPNDWIIFNRHDSHLWKIKSNGDSLTRLTQEGTNYHPCWSPDGQWIAYHVGLREGQSPLQLISQDGLQKVDSFAAEFRDSYPIWSPDGEQVVATTATQLYHYHFPTREITRLTTGNYFGPGPVVWFPDSRKVLWTSGEGLYTTDVISKETQTLRLNCDAYRYIFGSVHPSGEEILVSRSHGWLVGRDSIFYETSIVRMKPDGSGEEVVLE